MNKIVECQVIFKMFIHFLLVFVELVKKVSPEQVDKPDFLKNGDAAVVKLRPTTPLVIEKKDDIPQLANFAIRDSGSTVAAGMCIDLVKKN